MVFRDVLWVLATGALALQFAVLHAEPMPLSDGPGGATCRHYSVAGRLAWERKLGDWADAAGERYGERAYASEALRGMRNGTPVAFDVSALARQWLSGEHPNTGIFLRATGGSGSVLFHSRESKDPGTEPILELAWSDGSLDRLKARADTFLDCSTHRSSGSSQVLRVGSDQTALLVFEPPRPRGRKLAEATLHLQAFKQYAKGVEVGVFRPAPRWADAAETVEEGLAARYPRDGNIAKDRDVIFATSFETPDWKNGWKPLSGKAAFETVREDAGNRFEPLDGAALKTTLREGENTALNLSYPLGQNGGNEPEELYFRYYLRFGDDWSPDVDGGKLPGIAGTYGKGGWGMRRADGTNGWSARGAFSRMTVAPGGGTVTPIGSYVYHADMKGDSGNHWGWNLGPTGLLRNNKWYAVEQYVRLNTPGERNGVFRAWIDGQLAYERDGLRFRDLDGIRIESVWLNVYHGGRAKSPRDMSLYIDNLVIAKRYVGPRVP
ncbi:hypothetical protein PA01_11630 [Azoarcus sp. PA01]|nr:hypothetical protein PA01_11630 [Azoarcus sp. PA01]